jgi:hypothetical protein
MFFNPINLLKAVGTTPKYFLASIIARKLDRGSVDRNSVDRNCVLSLDRNFVNHLTEILDSFQLIESFNNDFGQTPKN